MRKFEIALSALLAIVPLHAGINIWTSHGPGGGNINELAIDPKNPDTLYVSAGNGVVFKSADGGASWSSANSGVTGPVYGLAIDPENTSTLYAWGGQLFKSTDGAQSWNKLTLTAGIGALVLDPRNPATLYAAAGNSGVLKSTDGGVSWTSSSSGLRGSGVSTLTLSRQNPSTLYAGVNFASGAVNLGSVFRSSDGGANWMSPLQQKFLALGLAETNTCDTWNYYFTRITGRDAPPADQLSCYPADNRELGITADQYVNALQTFANRRPDAAKYGLLANANKLLVDPQDANKVYALTFRGISVSTDGALTWDDANPGLAGPYSVAMISVDAGNPGTVYAGLSTAGRLYKSVDGGLSWAPSSLPGNGRVNIVAIDPRNSGTVYAGTSFGLFKTTDAASSWSSRDSGLASSNIFSLVADPQNRGTVYATVAGGPLAIYKTTDAGTTWTRNDFSSQGVTFGILAIDPRNSAILYAGGLAPARPALFKSTDAGATWFMTGLQELPGGLVIDPRNSNTLYARSGLVGGGIIKSTDGGNTWRAVSSGLGGTPNNVPNIFPLIMDRQNPDTLYAVRSTDGQMFRTTDGAASWNAVNTGWDGHLFHAVALAADSQDSNTIYAGTAEFDCGYGDTCPDNYYEKAAAAGGPGIFKTTDSGQTWVRLDSAPTVSAYYGFYSIAVDPQKAGTLYLTADYPSHVFRSTDGGASWTSLNAGLTATMVTSLAVDGQDPNTLYAGTIGGGVFTITLASQ